MKLGNHEAGRQTFRQISSASRQQSAASAWSRAPLASDVRCEALTRGNHRAAMVLACMKAQAMQRTMSIFPDPIEVELDRAGREGLLRVRWTGHGTLYVSAEALLPLPFAITHAALAPARPARRRTVRRNTDLA